MENKICEHDWQEDELMASGAVTLIGGRIDDLKQETKVVCKKCGVVDFVPKNIENKIDLTNKIK